jgi:chromosome segregation ATPase
LAILDWLKEAPLSAVYKERLVDSEKQISALEQKVINLDSKVSALEQEKIELQARLENSEQDRRALEEQIKQKIVHASPIEEIQEKILLALASRNLSTKEIASSVGTSEALAEFHLGELTESKYIENQIGFVVIIDSEPLRPWHITHAGRKYLVTHGLLK